MRVQRIQDLSWPWQDHGQSRWKGDYCLLTLDVDDSVDFSMWLLWGQIDFCAFAMFNCCWSDWKQCTVHLTSKIIWYSMWLLSALFFQNFTFLNSKCESAHLMKRNPRKVTWTVLYRWVALFWFYVLEQGGYTAHLWVVDWVAQCWLILQAQAQEGSGGGTDQEEDPQDAKIPACYCGSLLDRYSGQA